jgi:hypothetical protein
LQVGDTGPVESARRSNSRVLGSPFSGLSGQIPLAFEGLCKKTGVGSFKLFKDNILYNFFLWEYAFLLQKVSNV